MRTATFVSIAAVAASLLAQPVFAEPPCLAILDAPAAIPGYVPESPAAAFDRLLAPRTAMPAQPLATRSASDFERQFQRALWSPGISTPTLAARTEHRPAGIRP